MGTSFPTPYEAVVDKTKGLSVRGLAWLTCTLSMSHARLSGASSMWFCS